MESVLESLSVRDLSLHTLDWNLSRVYLSSALLEKRTRSYESREDKKSESIPVSLSAGRDQDATLDPSLARDAFLFRASREYETIVCFSQTCDLAVDSSEPVLERSARVKALCSARGGSLWQRQLLKAI